MKLSLIPAVFLALTGTAAFAADKTVPGEWKTSIEVGFVSTSGNTNTDSLNLKANSAMEQDAWRHSLNASMLKASDRKGSTADKMSLGGKSDYKLEDPAYLFATATYEDDKFSGFDYQASVAAGYGWRFFDDNDMKLDLEAGPGARQSKPNNGVSKNEGLVRVAANFSWQLSESSTFGEVFVIEAGEDSTISKSETSLTSQVNSSLSMKLTLTLRNNSDAPAGTKKTDSETSATLVYGF